MKATDFNNPEKGKITVIAHSLGCYISSNYVVKHPENVKEMIFLSPAGVNGAPE